jgi:hypothetical protein
MIVVSLFLTPKKSGAKTIWKILGYNYEISYIFYLK